MTEYIVYKGIVPFVRFSKAAAAADVASGQYRWEPPIKAAPATTKTQPKEDSWAESPNETAVNLNTANVSEMADLPMIGITTAKRIIDNRPLKHIEDAIALNNKVDWLKLLGDGLIYLGAPE